MLTGKDYLWAYDKASKYFVWNGFSLWMPPDFS
jgi:hypothetical protein